MARFTIGIPTYNRANFLGKSLDAACNQTERDIEILVSDDASTDETPEVVRSYGERVRYHRNAENIGMWPNFIRLAELASSEYFSWLQDDDLIHRDFVRRASEAFARSEDIVFYACYLIYSRSSKSIKQWDTVHGPMIPLNWMDGEPRVIDGLMAVPFCMFQSIAIMPAIAFRTSAVRRAARHVLEDCPLYNENIITAAILSEGKAVIDPWIGAIHRFHFEQEHLRIGKDSDEVVREILTFQKYFEEFVATLPGRWREEFAQCLHEIPAEHRVEMIARMVPAHKYLEYWASAPALATEVRDMLLAGVSPQASEAIAWSWQWQSGAEAKNGVKARIKRSVPPRLWKIARLCRRAMRYGVEFHVR
jgi:glycosyltransferase involved in cell wall biosynthesis